MSERALSEGPVSRTAAARPLPPPVLPPAYAPVAPERPSLVDALGLLVVLAVLLTYESLAMFVHLARITVDPEIGYAYHWVNGVLLGLGVYMLRLRRGTFWPNLIFAALLLYGTVMGVLRDEQFTRPFFGQLYHWSIMFMGFNLGFSYNGTLSGLEKALSFFSYFVTVMSALGFVAIEQYRLETEAGVYIGYPTAQLLLPFCFFLAQGRWRAALLPLALIFSAGKRGPLVAAVFLLAYIPASRRFEKTLSRALLAAIVLGALVVGLLGGLDFAVGSEVFARDSFMGRTVEKWNMTLTQFANDPTRATSGRDLEIKRAVEHLRATPDLLFGQGFGWYVEMGTERQHYVHFAYLNYLVNYGVVGALVFFALLAGLMWDLGNAASRPAAPPLIRFVTYFLLGNLVVTATASLISVSLLFWIMLGVGTRMAREQALRAPMAARLPRPGLAPAGRGASP